jgi:hypothetical protein
MTEAERQQCMERIKALEELIRQARQGSPDMQRWLQEVRELRQRLAGK